MGLPSCLFDRSAPLVLDASVAINLNATGKCASILDAIPNPIVILDAVLGELESGRIKGRTDADMVEALVKTGRVQTASLSHASEGNFLALVCGRGSATLDDGEAATIAWAVAHGGIPIIDEKKGLALCQERFPSVQTGTTVDVLSHTDVVAAFGRDELADAIFNALTIARMRVQDRHIPWVVQQIGSSRAPLCHSLPLSARTSHSLDDKRDHSVQGI
jgi:predicted nucleic acid-binding protein